MNYEIAVLAHRIARVALYGVDAAILHFLHNSHMVGRAVLASIIQIETGDVAGAQWATGPASGVFLMG